MGEFDSGSRFIQAKLIVIGIMLLIVGFALAKCVL